MRTLLLALCCLLCGCVTTTEKGAVGVTRSQFMGFISSEQVVSMANQSYSQTKLENQNKGLLDQNPEMVARVKAIALKLIPTTAEFRKDAPSWAWEVHVITSSQLNAYCMPGGKIMFYSGLIEGLHLSDGEIATVMGHEISHALREHGRERMSEQMAEQGLVVGLETIGVMDPKYAQIEQMASSVFYTLPHSRLQESEADEMGVELMARAGYDPRESLHLWRKMDSAAGGSKPPEFLSTHPADKRRIQQLEILMPKVVPLYEKTRS
jgi:predicted Zn-dependent protease